MLQCNWSCSFAFLLFWLFVNVIHMPVGQEEGFVKRRVQVAHLANIWTFLYVPNVHWQTMLVRQLFPTRGRRWDGFGQSVHTVHRTWSQLGQSSDGSLMKVYSSRRRERGVKYPSRGAVHDDGGGGVVQGVSYRASTRFRFPNVAASAAGPKRPSPFI